MNVKEAIFRGQARTVEDAVDAWNAADEAAGARDTDDVVTLYIAFASLAQGWYDEAWEQLFQNRVRHVNETGNHLKKWFTRAVELSRLVARCVADTRGKGYVVEGADAIPTLTDDFERMVRDIDEKWPWVNPDELAASIAAEERGGRRRPAKEVFDELRRRVR
ncbi:MAG: hypothetical protein K2R98_06500 [Gemmataceae bacterium]|nr:hypothetical protein [Gemmataceae bacterium]